ncbi:MAG TPA: hypothetical protein ENL10_03895 [Candidatus Cloacimonetes bacterium]|nr:hypothetical protein [Candidatus Cloacimonadota bacterium]
MKNHHKFLPLITVLVFLIILAGCAAKVKMLAPPSQAPTLRYVMPEGKPFTYTVSTGFNQSISMMGVPIKTTVLKDMTVTFYQLAFAQEAYQLQGVINDISMKITAPGTNLTPNLSQIPGKTFEMTVTNTGEEIGVMGADKLTYSLGEEGERNMENDFEKFFPDLPVDPLNPGDTWTTTDTVLVDAEGMATTIVTQTDNTLEGYELINGHDCAKITGTYTSTITGSGTKNGSDMETTLEIAGKETLYFDYKMGVLVLQKSSGNGGGDIKISGEKEMTLPMSQTVTNKLELVE